MIGPSFLADRPLTVLFYDGDNSGPSLIAEAILRHRARGQVRALSAGRTSAAEVAPEVRQTLAAARIPADGLESKPWQRFQSVFQPRIDVVIFICGNPHYDGTEVLAGLPGGPMCVHWPMENPAHVEGEAQRRAAYDHVRRKLERTCDAFVSLLWEEQGSGSGLGEVAGDLAPHEQRPVGEGWVPA